MMTKITCDCCGKEIVGGIGCAEIVVKKSTGAVKEKFKLHETCASAARFKLITFFEIMRMEER